MPDEDQRAETAIQRSTLVQALVWWAIMAILIAIGIVGVSFIAAFVSAPPG